jgi:hypothetical protein
MQCGAEISDHFAAWMALGAAVLAAVMALAGVGLAGLFEARREAARRQHERTVRFHDERLEAYVEYMGATLSLIAAARVWIAAGAVGAFTDSPALDLSRSAKAFSRVSMLAKPAVYERLGKVHCCIQQLIVEHQSAAAMERIANDTIQELADFETAAKEELGIDQVMCKPPA